MQFFRSIFTPAAVMAGALLTQLLVASQSFAIDAETRKLLTGNWQWEHSNGICQKKTMSNIRFSENGEQMYFSAHAHDHSNREIEEVIYTYNIIQHPKKLRAFIEGETRVNTRGDVVMWDIKIINDNEFCWQRSDWQSGECTRSLLKC